MSNQNLNRLFRPGDGAVPPYLAGRSGHKVDYFFSCSNYIVKNSVLTSIGKHSIFLKLYILSRQIL